MPLENVDLSALRHGEHKGPGACRVPSYGDADDAVGTGLGKGFGSKGVQVAPDSDLGRIVEGTIDCAKSQALSETLLSDTANTAVCKSVNGENHEGPSQVVRKPLAEDLRERVRKTGEGSREDRRHEDSRVEGADASKPVDELGHLGGIRQIIELRRDFRKDLRRLYARRDRPCKPHANEHESDGPRHVARVPPELEHIVVTQEVRLALCGGVRVRPRLSCVDELEEGLAKFHQRVQSSSLERPRDGAAAVDDCLRLEE